MDAIADAGVDLLLAGHNHRASSHHAHELVTGAGPALVIQAGTATSTRVRDEAQSFNLIEVGRGEVTLTVEAWDGDQFMTRDAGRFVQTDKKWESTTGERLAEAPQA